jgi:DNA-binding CsgD family transcriptional regulator
MSAQHAILTNPLIDQYYFGIKTQYSLSNREIEVLKLLTFHGQTNRELGVTLEITEKTMKNHISRIHDKTKTNSTRELQALIFRESVIPLLINIFESTINDPIGEARLLYWRG